MNIKESLHNFCYLSEVTDFKSFLIKNKLINLLYSLKSVETPETESFKSYFDAWIINSPVASKYTGEIVEYIIANDIYFLDKTVDEGLNQLLEIVKRDLNLSNKDKGEQYLIGLICMLLLLIDCSKFEIDADLSKESLSVFDLKIEWGDSEVKKGDVKSMKRDTLFREIVDLKSKVSEVFQASLSTPNEFRVEEHLEKTYCDLETLMEETFAIPDEFANVVQRYIEALFEYWNSFVTNKSLLEEEVIEIRDNLLQQLEARR